MVRRLTRENKDLQSYNQRLRSKQEKLGNLLMWATREARSSLSLSSAQATGSRFEVVKPPLSTRASSPSMEEIRGHAGPKDVVW